VADLLRGGTPRGMRAPVLDARDRDGALGFLRQGPKQ
jgi:hypothetical protein